MITVKEVILHKVDLKKLLKQANLSLRQLAKEAGIDYVYLNRVSNGYFSLSEAHWNKIKNILDQYGKSNDRSIK